MNSKLIFIPTPHELRCFSREFIEKLSAHDCSFEVCGFGPVISGARAMQAIAQHQPSEVWLAGIAGAYDDQAEIGTAIEFDTVSCYGIGASSGKSFMTSSEMGWLHWQGPPEIGDTLALASQVATGYRLLTCCAASADAQEVAWKLEKFPGSYAEDMEGFAVATACQLANVPLRIVRGISNRAGDRNQERWQLQQAMIAVELHLHRKLLA